MKRILWAAILAVLTSTSGWALPLMPDFSNIPTGWVVDRYDPDQFANIGNFAGRDNVLAIGISPNDGLNLRPAGFQSTFYNTQGRNHAITGGVGDSLTASLYIETSWRNPQLGNVRSDMWGVVNTEPSADYPIIGFTNYGGTPRLRIWDDETANGWVDLAAPVNFGGWMEFEIRFAGAYQYYVDGVLVYTDATIPGGTPVFTATIMQAYNFCGDPSLVGAVCNGYVAHWDNQRTEVPEPATFTVIGMGLIGLAAARRRREQQLSA